MSEVQRFLTNSLIDENHPNIPDGFILKVVAATEFDRVTAERDALQQLLNAADQRIDELAATPIVERQVMGRVYHFDDGARCHLTSEGRSLSDDTPLYTSPPAPVSVVLDEREEFVAWVRREWPQAPLSNVRDLLPKDDPRYGEYCDETLQRAWVGWQARAALSENL